MTDFPQTGVDLVVRHARVWPSPDEPVGAPQTIVIRDGVIRAIRPDGEDGEDDEDADAALPSLDAEGRVVTAGFVNGHVHFTESVWAGAAKRPAARLQEALDDMLLTRGFATVWDLASRPQDTTALRRRIASGELRRPRILTAAAGIRPWAGTPFYVKPDVPWYLRWLLPAPATALGARLTVGVQARQGAQLIKLFTGSYVTPRRVKPMRLAVARAAVDAPHRRGLKVLAHPSNQEGTAVAVQAGVDALAHVPDETEGTAELLAQAVREGIRMIPTLRMFAATVSEDEGYLGPIRQALADFRAQGGRVVFGTDVGYLPDRDTRPEFLAMQAAGMGSADILRSLTVEPAAFVGTTDAGTVRPGQRGDLTVWQTRSTAPEPADFADVRAVVQAGRRVYPG